MKIIKWLKSLRENKEIDLSKKSVTINTPTNTPPPKVKLRPAGAKVILPSIEELRRGSRGEEQKEDKKETLEQEKLKYFQQIQDNQEVLRENQGLIREELKEMENKQVNIIKMLMSIKEKL